MNKLSNCKNEFDFDCLRLYSELSCPSYLLGNIKRTKFEYYVDDIIDDWFLLNHATLNFEYDSSLKVGRDNVTGFESNSNNEKLLINGMNQQNKILRVRKSSIFNEGSSTDNKSNTFFAKRPCLESRHGISSQQNNNRKDDSLLLQSARTKNSITSISLNSNQVVVKKFRQNIISSSSTGIKPTTKPKSRGIKGITSKHKEPVPVTTTVMSNEIRISSKANDGGEDDDILKMLRKHNEKFVPKPTYVPQLNSVRDVRTWERGTGKSWSLLTIEEKEKANDEIAKYKFINPKS